MASTCASKYVGAMIMLVLFTHGVTTQNTGTSKVKFIPLETNEVYSQKSRDDFKVYCFLGSDESLTQYLYLFGSFEVMFSPAVGTNGCDLIQAENETLVYKMSNSPSPLMGAWKQIWQSFSSYNMSTDHIKLSPITKTCFGLECDTNVSIKTKLRTYDPRYIGLFLIGIILFFQADRFSRSVVIFYGTGISAGVILSLLIIVYVMGKFVPAKKAMAAFVLFGWSFSLYFIKWLWNKMVIERALPENTHTKVVLGYFAVSALISFAVCYRYGPVKEERTLNLIKWSIWLVSWLLIYNGTQVPEVSISVIVILFTWNIMQAPVMYISGKIGRKWVIWFPPKRKLLTEDEYQIEGYRETKKALKELREFCHSPDCDSWKIISKLQSPSRFSKFIQGESLHVTDEEYAAHVIDSDTSFDLQRDDDDTNDGDDENDYLNLPGLNLSGSGDDSFNLDS